MTPRQSIVHVAPLEHLGLHSSAFSHWMSHTVVAPLQLGVQVSPNPTPSNVQVHPSGQIGEESVLQAVVQHPPLVHDEHGLVHMGASQLPALHVKPAPQGMPQALQCIVDVVRSTSHPFAPSPSQSPRPGSQVKPQIPPAHASVASGVGPQDAPQTPQSAIEVASSASHPLDALPSQSSYPAEQVSPQVPSAHVAVAFGPAAHALVQVPQWAGSRRSASQPFDTIVSHSWNSGSHV
jgi:hypothetical protein